MTVEAFDHLYVRASSFGEALAFWRALGFELLEEWRGGDGYPAGRLRAGDVMVLLAESDTPGVTVHFRMGGADELARELPKHPTVAVETPLEPTHWNSRWIRVVDPDANLFALEEPLPPD